MKEIEYRVTYAGRLNADGSTDGRTEVEIERVNAAGINSGFVKALKRAREPLGNGRHREIASVEFWRVV